jgi:hypothetical protein
VDQLQYAPIPWEQLLSQHNVLCAQALHAQYCVWFAWHTAHDFGQGRKKPHGKKEAKKSKVRGNMTHIFVQFMDAVWQLWSQCPRSFEVRAHATVIRIGSLIADSSNPTPPQFSESYLLFILDSLYRYNLLFSSLCCLSEGQWLCTKRLTVCTFVQRPLRHLFGRQLLQAAQAQARAQHGKNVPPPSSSRPSSDNFIS